MLAYWVLGLAVGLFLQSLVAISFWSKWLDSEAILDIRTKDVDRLTSELDEYREFRQTLLKAENRDRRTVVRLTEIICTIRTLLEEDDALQENVLEREED